jgi:hypothetical protein
VAQYRAPLAWVEDRSGKDRGWNIPTIAPEAAVRSEGDRAEWLNLEHNGQGRMGGLGGILRLFERSISGRLKPLGFASRVSGRDLDGRADEQPFDPDRLGDQ